MALYRSIQISFWNDAKVADEFTPEDKYFYLYLFTNPHTNLCGCYEISMKHVSLETGYSMDTIERLLQRFEQVHRVIRFNRATKEILILNWHKYNWTSSEKFRKPLLNEVDSVKCKEFKEYLTRLINGDTVSIPYPYGSDTTVTNTVTNTNTVSEIKEKRRRFIPPTVEEVREYCRERNNNIDPAEFIDFYESKGWMIGSNKMKDWRASIRTWERKNRGRSVPVSDYIVDQLSGTLPEGKTASEELKEKVRRMQEQL